MTTPDVKSNITNRFSTYENPQEHIYSMKYT